MNESIFIVGQGIAGSMLAWNCERHGIDFRIFDPGHARAASRVGAGLLSPVTGKRLAPSWGFAAWRDSVLADYRQLETELGEKFVRELSIRRSFRDDAQREYFRERSRLPSISPWIDRLDDEAIWLRGAIQVETGKLISALRRKWIRQGKLVEQEFEGSSDAGTSPVIWCTGGAPPPGIRIPWEPSRGEIVTGRLSGLAEDIVLNDGQWLLPSGDGEVRVGSTFDRENLTAGSTSSGRKLLAEAAERLAGEPLTDVVGDAGLRVTVPDHRPVVGWLDLSRAVGIFAGLAAKGALWAPALAKQWTADGLAGEYLASEVRTARYSG